MRQVLPADALTGPLSAARGRMEADGAGRDRSEPREIGGDLKFRLQPADTRGIRHGQTQSGVWPVMT